MVGMQGALKRATVVLVAVAIQLQAAGPLQAHTASGDSNAVHRTSADTLPNTSQSNNVLSPDQPGAAPGDCALAGLVSLPAYNGDVESTPVGDQWTLTGFGGNEARTGQYGIRDAWTGDGYIAWSADHAGNPAMYVAGKQYVLSVWIFIQSTSTYRLKWGEQLSPPSGFTPPTYGDHALLDKWPTPMIRAATR